MLSSSLPSSFSPSVPGWTPGEVGVIVGPTGFWVVADVSCSVSAAGVAMGKGEDVRVIVGPTGVGVVGDISSSV